MCVVQVPGTQVVAQLPQSTLLLAFEANSKPPLNCTFWDFSPPTMTLSVSSLGDPLEMHTFALSLYVM